MSSIYDSNYCHLFSEVPLYDELWSSPSTRTFIHVWGYSNRCLVVNMCGFNPFFLKLLKLPICGDSLARIISEVIPEIVLTILMFAGKFSIKVHPRMLLKHFSKETWMAFKVGFATFVSLVSYSIPLVLMQKFVNEAATSIDVYDTVIKV